MRMRSLRGRGKGKDEERGSARRGRVPPSREVEGLMGGVESSSFAKLAALVPHGREGRGTDESNKE